MGVTKKAIRRVDTKKESVKNKGKDRINSKSSITEKKSKLLINKKHNANVRGLKLDKNRGQHLLRNPGITDQIVKSCEFNPSDNVLEIGPGTGNLTEQILPRCRSLLAIDVDERMIAEVRKRVLLKGYQNFDTIRADALSVKFPDVNVLVANTPYQISSKLVFKIANHSTEKKNNQYVNRNFRCAVLMFQKEFGERMMAKPTNKNYSRLSVNTQFFFHVSKVCKVDRKSFTPPPKVDSVVVKLTPRRNKYDIDFVQWDALLRICFIRSNKTIRANFMSGRTLQNLYAIYTEFGKVRSNVDINSIDEFKLLIDKILVETELGSKRAIVTGELQYLKLLTTFMEHGVYFSTGITAEKYINEMQDE